MGKNEAQSFHTPTYQIHVVFRFNNRTFVVFLLAFARTIGRWNIALGLLAYIARGLVDGEI